MQTAAQQTLRVAIRLARRGCANRPVYDIVVMPKIWRCNALPYETIGVYDPMPNERDELIVGINFERLHLWLGKGARISEPLLELLGIAGYLPIHPRTYMKAWRKRREIIQQQKAATEEKQADPAPE